MRVALSEADTLYAQEQITARQLDSGYLVFCPFTTRPQKHWFEDRWVELADRLLADLGLIPVLLGGPADRDAAQRIQEQVKGRLINLAGVTSLTQAAALIDRAALLIGVDTGLTHMGIAFSRPTLALFGSTCPYQETTRENALVLYHKLDCSPCKRNPTCEGRFDCMRAISVDEVAGQASRLVKSGEEV
jgi:heptosyltransferase-1